MLYTALFAGALGSQVIKTEVVEVPNPMRDPTINLATIFDDKTTTAPFVERLLNKWTYFCANVTLGTPGQQFLVQLDTGSSDLWVPAKVIKPDGYEPTKSSTFKFLSRDFYVRYIKDFAQGYWAMDTLSIPGSGVTVQNQKFGVATNIPESTIGILGLSPGLNDTNHFLTALVDQGVIARKAYSVYLGDARTETGTILFGGKDESRFNYLTTLPLKDDSSYTVEMDGVQYGNSTHGKMDVVLDTGTSLNYLPDDLVAQVASSLSCVLNPSLGMYICPMHDTHAANVSFIFGNTTVSIAEQDLFWPLSYFTLKVSPYRVLTLVSNSQSMGNNVLGSSFLRNAYVLFEPDRKQVQLGQYVNRNFTRIVAV